MMQKRPIDDDPPPTPPVRPELEDCCGSGCDPCIFDIYEQAMERYEADYRAWEARRTKAPGRGKRASSP